MSGNHTVTQNSRRSVLPLNKWEKRKMLMLQHVTPCDTIHIYIKACLRVKKQNIMC